MLSNFFYLDLDIDNDSNDDDDDDDDNGDNNGYSIRHAYRPPIGGFVPPNC